MRKYLGIPVLLIGLLPAVARAQATPYVVHWVNTDSADYTAAALAFAPNGDSDLLMPAPQFSATYRLSVGHLVMRMSDGSTDSSFALRGDSLVEKSGRVVWVRTRAPSQQSALGTWHSVAPSPVESFMTLRSDGVVVLEVGFLMTVAAHGDTVQLHSDRLPGMTYTLRQSGDTVHLLDTTGRDHQFIRRPWGCLNVGAGNAPANECR